VVADFLPVSLDSSIMGAPAHRQMNALGHKDLPLQLVFLS